MRTSTYGCRRGLSFKNAFRAKLPILSHIVLDHTHFLASSTKSAWGPFLKTTREAFFQIRCSSCKLSVSVIQSTSSGGAHRFPEPEPVLNASFEQSVWPYHLNRPEWIQMVSPGGGGGGEGGRGVSPLFGLYDDTETCRWTGYGFFGLAVLNRVYNLTCLCP